MIDKKLSKRILAYIIDSTIVLLLTVLITNIKYLNPTYDNALEKSNELQSLNLSNIEIQNYLPLYYKDSEISEDEYNDLIKDNDYFGYLIVDAYSDSVITEEEYNYIIAEAKKIYNEKAPQVYKDAIESNWYSYLIYLVVYFFYFVIFNIITKGITLGKKITGLQIVGLDNKEATFGQYLLRSLIAYGYFVYLLELIVPHVIPMKYLMYVVGGLSIVMNFLQIVVSISVISNDDNRGLHDILAKTKVIDVREKQKDKIANLKLLNEEKQKELDDITKKNTEDKDLISKESEDFKEKESTLEDKVSDAKEVNPKETVKPEVVVEPKKNNVKRKNNDTVEAKTSEVKAKTKNSQIKTKNNKAKTSEKSPKNQVKAKKNKEEK